MTLFLGLGKSFITKLGGRVSHMLQFCGPGPMFIFNITISCQPMALLFKEIRCNGPSQAGSRKSHCHAGARLWCSEQGLDSEAKFQSSTSENEL